MLEDVRNYLLGRGVVTASECMVAGVPAKPDHIVALFQYAGFAPASVRDHRAKYRLPRLQVQVRDKYYDAAEAHANTIYDALLDVTNMYLGDVWYLRISPLQEPYDLGNDENNRSIVAFNAQIEKRDE